MKKKKDIKRVYVAGPLNANAVEFMQNIHQMLWMGNTVRKAGFSPFIPCLDILLGILDGTMDYSDYFKMSQPWLEISDAVLVSDGAQRHYTESIGTMAEIKTAKRLHIPVFFSLEKLEAYCNGRKR
jgi:hypothetical protein